MKKYMTLAIAALCAFNFTACEKFLDYTPEGKPTADHYFLNDEQANNAIDIVYYRLFERDGMFSRDMYWEQGCANDMVWGKTRGFNPLATLTYTGNEGPLVDTFGRIYNYGLSRANWIVNALLQKQENESLSDVETRVLGEAYFLRAQFHLLAAYRYGTKELGVPFVAYEEVEGGYNYEIPEQLPSVTDNYAYIVSDLEKAEAILPRFEEYDAANRGRAHKASAAALMAKVYAYWAMWDTSKWDNVISCVNRLESTYGRGLVDNYPDLFAPDFEKGFWNKEYCWGIPGEGGPDGGGGGGVELTGVMLEDKGWGKYNGWGQIKPSYDLYEELAKDNWDEDGDGTVDRNIRLRTTILEYNDKFEYFGDTMYFYSPQNLEAGFQCNKYMQAFAPKDCIDLGWVLDNSNYPVTRVMWPIVRFADAMLLRAEANLAKGNAAAATTDINKIRQRSNLKPLAGNATWADLYHERRCELAFEFGNDHAFDCKRWAVSGAPEIKKLAEAELNSHPRVRQYFNYNFEIKSTFKEVENPQTGEKKKIRVADDVVAYAGGVQKVVNDRTLKVVVYGADDPEKVWDKDYKTPILAEYYSWPEVRPYEDYLSPVKVWTGNEKCLTFPYPTDEITKSMGKLQNPPSWR